jgi:hypothetical protein
MATNYHNLILYVMLVSQMIWEPYSEEVLNSLPTYCLAGRILWGAQVPLICFHVVEWHLPYRVMRQFGFRQFVPAGFDTSRVLHKHDFRPQTDWTEKHNAYINNWEHRYDDLVQGEPVEPWEPENEVYMNWYLRITRRFMCRKLLMSDYMVTPNFLLLINVLLYLYIYEFIFLAVNSSKQLRRFVGGPSILKFPVLMVLVLILFVIYFLIILMSLHWEYHHSYTLSMMHHLQI